jgi:hypothetical protein
MRLLPVLAAPVFLVAAAGAIAAPNSTRIAETGAFLLGNAHRCGVPDERVVRAGKVIRDLMLSASDDRGEQTAAKSRFSEIFRAAAQAEGSAPPCKSVLTQFERLEQFPDSPGLPITPRHP